MHGTHFPANRKIFVGAVLQGRLVVATRGSHRRHSMAHAGPTSVNGNPLPSFTKFVPGAGLEHSFLSRCFYYSQRLVTIPVARAAVASVIARVVRARHGGGRPPELSTKCESLQRDGFTALGELLTPQQCAEIAAYLAGRHLTARYHQKESFALADVPASVKMAEYDLADIICCPHLLALSNSEQLLTLAEQYLGCKPTLSSLMLRWSLPADTPAGNAQRFHRDADDWRYMKVMVYLTDVSEDNGPFVYVLGTHNEAAPVRIKIETDDAIVQRYGSERIKVVTAARGAGFAVDTSGIHKGAMPRTSSRLMLQIQYSLLPSFAYQYSPLTYDGPLEFDPYVNRLLLKREQTATGEAPVVLLMADKAGR